MQQRAAEGAPATCLCRILSVLVRSRPELAGSEVCETDRELNARPERRSAIARPRCSCREKWTCLILCEKPRIPRDISAGESLRCEPGPRNWSVRPYLVSGPPCRHQGRPAAKWGGPLTKFRRPSSENRAATPQNRAARRAAASLGRAATVAAGPPSGRPPSN
eukprot:scaffold48242_cov51-Phaeocystis_antarctica.AAC.3